MLLTLFFTVAAMRYGCTLVPPIALSAQRMHCAQLSERTALWFEFLHSRPPMQDLQAIEAFLCFCNSLGRRGRQAMTAPGCPCDRLSWVANGIVLYVRYCLRKGVSFMHLHTANYTHDAR